MTQPIIRAGRLLLLHRLREAGLLDDERLRTIGDRFGVSRYTIARDMEALELVEQEFERLKAEEVWPDPSPIQALRDAGYLKIQDMAVVSGYSLTYLGYLARENIFPLG